MDQARPRSRKRCHFVLSAAIMQGNSVTAAPSNEAGIRVKARCLQRALLLLCLTFPAVFGGTATAQQELSGVAALCSSRWQRDRLRAGTCCSLLPHLTTWTESEPFLPSPTSNNTSSLAFSVTKDRNAAIKPSCTPSLAFWQSGGASEVLSD